MDLKKIEDVKEDGCVSFIGTLKSRSQLKKWNRSKTSGSMITGVIVDNTGGIDFVCWTNASEKFDSLLKTNTTYKFMNCKAGLAKENYSKTNHKYQITLDTTSVLEQIECKPFVPPISVTPIADLIIKQNYQKVNVIGKVMSIPPPEKLGSTGTDIMKVKIQDNTACIQLSLMGNEIKNCNFAINDVLVLENVEMRIYGMLRVLNGSTGIRTVNPKHRDCSAHMPSNNTNIVDLSPAKSMPKQKTVENLNKEDGRQIFKSGIFGTNLMDCVYDKCPRSQCRSRVVKLDNLLFRCNRCESDYLLSAKGIRLIIDLSQNTDENKSIVLFNEMAEQFLKKTSLQVSEMAEISIKELEKLLMKQHYKFTVGPTKNDKEFLCESFEIATAEDKHEPQTSDSSPSLNKSEIKQFQYIGDDIAKDFSVDERYSKIKDGNGNITTPINMKKNVNISVQDDTPLDLSQHCDEETPTLFELNLPQSSPETCENDSQDGPLDLSSQSSSEPSSRKKYKFARRLLPDFE